MLHGLYGLGWSRRCYKVYFYHNFCFFLKNKLSSRLLCWYIQYKSIEWIGCRKLKGCAISLTGADTDSILCLYFRVMTMIALLEVASIATITILARNIWGKLYSDEEEVIKYVAKMMPLLALSDFLDGFQCVLSGSNWAFISKNWIYI